jgi:hypothetical protein
LLDRPVSNSGRLRQLIEDLAAHAAWPWHVRLTDSPDRELVTRSGGIIATSDAAVLDRCGAWVPLSEAIVSTCAPAAWIVDLGA